MPLEISNLDFHSTFSIVRITRTVVRKSIANDDPKIFDHIIVGINSQKCTSSLTLEVK